VTYAKLARSVFLIVVLASAAATPAQQLVPVADANSSDASSPNSAVSPKPAPPTSTPHKLGPLALTINWRFRTEAWDWFEAPTPAQNAYAFEHSLLRIGLGQKSERFEWFVEGAQDAILDLPTGSVLTGRPGQLGLGGTYFVANGNGQNNANGFVRQAYVAFALPVNAKLKLGRFTFLDGAEVTPKDKSLATLVSSRLTQRLIGDFGFSAVGRSFDGAQLTLDTHAGNFTLFGARPTRGVYQIDAMGELAVDLFYGAYTVPVSAANSSGEFRLFSLGYVDERASVLKTDNRATALRTADFNHIRIGTYGLDYVHVFRTQNRGQFDVLFWGAVQNGSWGLLTQRAGSVVVEAGWQPIFHRLNPWFRAGYSYGSGDNNPTDGRHGTFFQVLPTPRPYARFPFYNMMNNEDFFASATFRLPRSVVIKSELHALRLANAQDLWYGGGGAFQPQTFGYTGRASAGNRSLANVWDVSMDVPLRYGFSLTTYYAHAWGKDLVQSIYPAGSNAQFGYVETNFHF
jgi:Alginate export